MIRTEAACSRCGEDNCVLYTLSDPTAEQLADIVCIKCKDEGPELLRVSDEDMVPFAQSFDDTFEAVFNEWDTAVDMQNEFFESIKGLTNWDWEKDDEASAYFAHATPPEILRYAMLKVLSL